jgi:RecA-family ATPase
MIQHLPLEELLATDPPPIPWIVPGIIARGAVTLVYGPPGVGKSIVLMELARAITEGQETIGLKCEKSRILLLDAENGKGEIHRRIRSLGFTQGIHPYEVQGFSIEVNYQEFEDALWHAEFPEVVILDSLRTLWPEGDENDSASVTRMLTDLQTLARNYKLAVVIIHHPNKSGGFRGSGALTAVPEIVINVGRKFRDKDETRRFLQWEKCRLGPARSMKWFAIQGSDSGQVQIVSSHAPVYSADPEKSELWPE